jgi:hypothetical protein
LLKMFTVMDWEQANTTNTFTEFLKRNFSDKNPNDLIKAIEMLYTKM